MTPTTDVGIHKAKKDFAPISNHLLGDTRLSSQALGVICSLLRHRDDWVITFEQVRTERKLSKEGLQKIFQELARHGYAELVYKRNERGQIKGSRWNIHEVPSHREPVEPVAGEPGNITIQKDNNTKDTLLEGMGEVGGSIQRLEGIQRIPPIPLEEVKLRLNTQDIPFYNKGGLGGRLEAAKTWVKDNVPETVKAGCRITERAMALKALSSETLLTKPVYHAKEKTSRLYCQGFSLQNLCSGARDILLDGHVKLDLEHAQFAILATVWDEPALKSFAANLWAELLASAGLENTKTNRDLLKETVYAAAYGSTWTTRRNKLRDALGIPTAAATRIMRVQILQKLFTARDIAFAKAYLKGYVTDAWGQQLTFANDKELASAMAAMAQSYELKILGPGLAYLFDSGIPITIFLHDGLYVESITPRQLKTVTELVDRQAASLGIDTRLMPEVVQATPRLTQPVETKA